MWVLSPASLASGFLLKELGKKENYPLFKFRLLHRVTSAKCIVMYEPNVSEIQEYWQEEIRFTVLLKIFRQKDQFQFALILDKWREMITRLFLVELKRGISKSLETVRAKRTSQRDKTFLIHVGDSCPVIYQVLCIAYLPSSVLRFLKTEVPLQPPMQSNSRAAGMTVMCRRQKEQRTKMP